MSFRTEVIHDIVSNNLKIYLLEDQRDQRHILRITGEAYIWEQIVEGFEIEPSLQLAQPLARTLYEELHKVFGEPDSDRIRLSGFLDAQQQHLEFAQGIVNRILPGPITSTSSQIGQLEERVNYAEGAPSSERTDRATMGDLEVALRSRPAPEEVRHIVEGALAEHGLLPTAEPSAPRPHPLSAQGRVEEPIPEEDFGPIPRHIET
jgi:hypothetical protein